MSHAFVNQNSKGPPERAGDNAAPDQPERPGMLWIPGGTFLMGSDKHYPEEAPAHKVSVSRARARSRGGIAFWSDVVARRAAIFLFRFFAAGFSYGVDRDDSPIARTRVLLPR